MFIDRDSQNIKFLNKYLNFLIQNGGSDLHIKSGGYIRGRINGNLVKFSKNILDEKNVFSLVNDLIGEKKFSDLNYRKSLDFSYTLNEDYRFRVNVFFQIDGLSLVFRTIPSKIPTIDELNLPKVVKTITDETMRGLILVTGPTGSGKTTTIASMINRMNHSRQSHIISIEDPVEFVYKEDKCIINQRSLGQDCNTFADSLKAALREDPDIIFVGEMRDLETIETALHAAETGHLVVSTLHTIDAKESINRVLSVFDSREQTRIKLSFAAVLQAVISQRLVVAKSGGRRPAVEILRKNVRIKEMILANKYDDITDAMRDGTNTYGMQTFDQHLFWLYRDGVISKDEALDKATNRADLDMVIRNYDSGKEDGENLSGEIKLQDL